jgi:hypothetical protein
VTHSVYSTITTILPQLHVNNQACFALEYENQGSPFQKCTSTFSIVYPIAIVLLKSTAPIVYHHRHAASHMSFFVSHYISLAMNPFPFDQ